MAQAQMQSKGVRRAAVWFDWILIGLDLGLGALGFAGVSGVGCRGRRPADSVLCSPSSKKRESFHGVQGSLFAPRLYAGDPACIFAITFRSGVRELRCLCDLLVMQALHMADTC